MLLVVLVFFFKQKTAYEMRISDWSSDVCSSDLRRARDTYQLRSLIDQLDFQMRGMTVADRIPVGTEEVIRTAPAARIRDLYDRYYRPERATLVMVGDFDPAAVEAKIRARFSGRSEERRVGTGWVSTCRFGWCPD